MARRLDDNRRGVMITPDSARRIAKAVQAYEQGRVNIKAKPLRTADDGDDEPIRIGLTCEPWARYTTQSVVLLYENDCEAAGSGTCDGSGSGSGEDTLEAYNRLFAIPENSLVYLAMAKNGCWQVIAAGCYQEGVEGSSGECTCLAIGGEDLTAIEGYNQNSTQILAHENGCLKWLDTTECSSGSGSS